MLATFDKDTPVGNVTSSVCCDGHLSNILFMFHLTSSILTFHEVEYFDTDYQ